MLLKAIRSLIFVAAPMVIGYAAQAARPAFEVASIKMNVDPNVGGTGGIRTLPGGRLTARNTLVNNLIRTAYGIRLDQLEGGPDWIRSTRYDIDAKAEENVSPEQIRLMLQSLLEDRFRLKVRREVREMTVLQLIPSRDGVRLPPVREGSCVTPNFDGPPVPPNAPPAMAPPTAARGGAVLSLPTPPCGNAVGNINGPVARLFGGRVTMERLVYTLSNMLGRTVIDRTGYTDLFDITLSFAADDALYGISLLPPPPVPANAPARAADPVPSIFTAFQPFGLRLESSKGPVEIIVIEKIEKPTEN